MIRVRRDAEIYRTDGGWFQARWHFSFDRYRDPQNMGWGPLRVFNDDRLVPGAVWPMHPHRDIEGLTYVMEGTFRHQDDLGTGGVLSAGSVQRMTLGSGAWHSEQNGSETEPMRFIQMWILPEARGLRPSVEQRVFTTEDRTDRLLEVFSPPGGPGVAVHRDVRGYVGRLRPGAEATHAFAAGRGGYLYVIEGVLEASGEKLGTGDAAKIADQPELDLRPLETTEVLMMDLPLQE